MVVGNVYEIECIVQFTNWHSGPTFARLIGYSSKNEPVFEDNGKFFCVNFSLNNIYPIKDKAA